MCVVYVTYQWHSVSRTVCGGRERGASTALASAPCQSHRMLRCVCDLTRLCVCRDLFTCVTWLIPMRALCMTRSCVWHDGTYVWHSQSLSVSSCVCHDSFICVTWVVHMCDMTRSYMWHDQQHLHARFANLMACSAVCVTWLICVCAMTHSHLWRDSLTFVTWRHVCDVTRSTCVSAPPISWHAHVCMWNHSCVCVPWRIHRCDMTRSYVWHDSFLRVTWLVYVFGVTHYVWHDSFMTWLADSFICVTWLIHDSFICVTWLIHDSFICVTWLIHVSFICVTWLIHDSFMCDMTHSWLIYMCDMNHDVTRSTAWAPRQSHCMLRCVYYVTRLCVCRDLFICVTWLIPPRTTIWGLVWHDSFVCVTWLITICDMTYSYVWNDSFIFVTFPRCWSHKPREWRIWQ